MYNEDYLSAVKKQLQSTILVVALVFIVFLALAIIVRNNTLGGIILVVGVCINIFIWGMYGTPVLAYYRFVNDIITGRSHETKGTIIKISKEPVYKDNKLFYYEIIVDENGTERMLLYDTNRKLPDIRIGESYDFKVHGNYVKEINL